MKNNNPIMTPKTPTLAATALGGLIAGVVTGATVAAARSARKVKTGCMTKQEAAAEVVREAGSMGLATTVGVTATALLGATGILSVAGVALFTAGSKYAIDSLLDAPACDIADKSKEEIKALPEKTEIEAQEAELI